MFLYQTEKYIACFGGEQGIFSIFCSCFVHKHKSILVCLSFQRTSGLLCFHVLWRIIVNYFIMFCAKSLIKLYPMIFLMFFHQTFVNAYRRPLGSGLFLVIWLRIYFRSAKFGSWGPPRHSASDCDLRR